MSLLMECSECCDASSDEYLPVPQRPFCVSEPPLAGLGATYDVHLKLIGKRVVDFLLVLADFFR